MSNKVVQIACIVVFLFIGCKETPSIEKIKSYIKTNEIKKVENELNKKEIFSKNDFEELCMVSLDNKNLEVPIMLIERGMSPDIYINDKPLSFYFVELGSITEFNNIIRTSINLDLKDNTDYLNIAEYAISCEKKDFITQIFKKSKKTKSEDEYIAYMFDVLKYAIEKNKNDYIDFIINDIEFTANQKSVCKDYFSSLIYSKVPDALLSKFISNTIDILLLNEDLIFYVVYNYQRLKDCDVDFFNYPMIINDKSEYFGEFFLMGEPEGLDKLFNLINCKNSFQLNGESQSIKQILEYRIKLLSGVIDNDKENEQRNAEEIIKLKVLIERI
nr:hypothetical protein [uncultured Treponema sp.]